MKINCFFFHEVGNLEKWYYSFDLYVLQLFIKLFNPHILFKLVFMFYSFSMILQDWHFNICRIFISICKFVISIFTSLYNLQKIMFIVRLKTTYSNKSYQTSFQYLLDFCIAFICLLNVLVDEQVLVAHACTYKDSLLASTLNNISHLTFKW